MAYGHYSNNTNEPARQVRATGITGRASKKRVFANQQVAHVWAQQSQNEGRSGNGNFYFRDATIFSYGLHWPLATFLPQDDGSKLVILNTDSYGNTTSGHLSDVRSALRGLEGVTVIETTADCLRAITQGWQLDEAKAAIISHKVECFKTRADALANPRKKAHYGEYTAGITLATGEHRAASLDCSDILSDAARLGVATPAIDVENMRAKIINAFALHFDPAKVAKRAKDSAKRFDKAGLVNAVKAFNAITKGDYVSYRTRQRFYENMARLIKTRPVADYAPLLARVQAFYATQEIDTAFAEANPDAASIVWQAKYGARAKPMTADQWLSGKVGPFTQYEPTLVRKRGTELETSRGANAPFRAAVAIYLKAADCLKHGKTWHRNGERMRAGAFELDSIAADGSIRIGCHTIQFAEMERLAMREAPNLVKPRFGLPACL